MAEKTEVVFEDARVRRLLSDLKSKTDKISNKHRTVVNIISAVVFRDVMDHFSDQRGPSARWPSWSRSYFEHMAKIGKGRNRILQDTGRLRGSFKPTDWRKSSRGIEWFNNAKTRSGFPYASAHNEGGPVLPKREFMWLSNKGLRDIESQIVNFLGK